MSKLVLVYGRSGMGKTTSLRNFKPEDVGFINVTGKALPFRGKFASTLVTDDYAKIETALRRTGKKSIVIDDAGYLITGQFMRGHSSAGAGNGVFKLYNELADNFWKLIEMAKTLPDDVIVYFLMHEERNDNGDVDVKTIGKLLAEKVCIPGLFPIVFRCMIVDGKHVFKTQSDGSDISKTPMEMFTADTIDNDLKMVDDTIREYYELNNKTEVENNV